MILVTLPTIRHTPSQANGGQMKISIRAKMIGGFAIVVALTIAVGVVGFTGLSSLNGSLHMVYANQLQSISSIDDVESDVKAMRIALRQAILVQAAQEKQQQAAKLAELDGQVREHMTAFEKLILSQEVRQRYEEVERSYADFKSYVDEAMAAALANDQAAAVEILANAAGAVAAMDQNIEKMANIKDAQAKAAYDEGAALFARSRLMIFAAIGISLTASVVIALYLSVFIIMQTEPTSSSKMSPPAVRRRIPSSSKTSPLRRGWAQACQWPARADRCG
jgi:methyl-accepting chemotaxis protein